MFDTHMVVDKDFAMNELKKKRGHIKTALEMSEEELLSAFKEAMVDEGEE